MCVSLWAWWEVVAAHHRVHDHACCHLQADCLESMINSGPLRSTMSMGTFTFYLFNHVERTGFQLSCPCSYILKNLTNLCQKMPSLVQQMAGEQRFTVVFKHVTFLLV